MSMSIQGYADCIRSTLKAAFCILNHPSQTVERHNKPEVEVRTSPELLLLPILICRNEDEKCLIEPAINSVRISISFKKSDDTEEMVARIFFRIMMNRADDFKIMRREAVKDFDISFLITNKEIEEMYRDKLIGFFIEFVRSIDIDIATMKMDTNARARSIVKNFLRGLCPDGN